MIDYFNPRPEDLHPFKTGPLATHLDGFAAFLVQRRYCKRDGWRKFRLAADLSGWLEQKHLRASELDEKKITVFLKAWWKTTPQRCGDLTTSTLLLRQLRGLRIIPSPAAALPPGFIGLMEQDYRNYLIQERGFMPATVGQYLLVMRRFLSHQSQSGKVRLKNLCASDVTAFVSHDSSRRGQRSAQFMATALRNLLGYFFLKGQTTTNLAGAVPRVAGGRLSELPRFLEPAQVEKILRRCNRRHRAGRRDYAILMLLARLGLRSSEVTGLELEDIDWNAGTLLVRGKGARLDRLPLPREVGQAIADYLQKGRPPCSSRRVFIQCCAPYECLAGSPTMGGIVRRALARAGLNPPHQGAHLLRHSLATRMLRRGASLLQIGQVLRHQESQTTEIYAKVDLDALRALAQPWPGGVR
jgi:site-specific recombinase XerD